MNLFDVQGKVVVITGGSGFLGQQYSKHLETEGATVVSFDVDTGVDVTDEKSVDAAVAKVVKEHGKIDGLITNAAANPAPGSPSAEGAWAPYNEFPAELFRKEIDLNLTGSFIAAKVVATQMMKQKSGSIIFISSDLGLIGPYNAMYPEGKFKDIAYGTSKAGVLGLMRFFATFLGPYNVRVNALAPGGMYKNHDPEFAKKNGSLNMLGRMAKEGEFNGPVQFLLSDASSYVTGAVISVDGGRVSF